MIAFPNAKINLGLNIVEKRNDGFHNIESIFYPIPLCDALELIENKNTTNNLFSSSGIPIPGNNSDNLCLKAYNLLTKDYALPPLKIHLHKHIPIGAGLGGGSSDAAFFITTINSFFNLNLSEEQQLNYAKQLGSDCSFFISNKPAFVKGKGDEFKIIDFTLSGKYIVLVYPNIHINTALAYSKIKPKSATRNLLNDIKTLSITDWKNYIHNDFEDALFPEFPSLSEIKNKLYHLGAEYAAMSGSGSTLFGLFSSPVSAKKYFNDCLVFEMELK